MRIFDEPEEFIRAIYTALSPEQREKLAAVVRSVYQDAEENEGDRLGNEGRYRVDV